MIGPNIDHFTVIPSVKFGNCPITFVSAGEHHAGAINVRGELYTWGLNTFGQCGVKSQPGHDVIWQPETPFTNKDAQVSFVACGGRHSLSLNLNSNVFSWGCNNYGQLGLSVEETESFCVPKEVVYFREKIVTWLSAGSYHSLALTIEGYCFTWGRNHKGQLGHEDAFDFRQRVPRIVSSALGVGVAQANCSYNATYLGCSDRLKNKPDSEVFNVWT